MAVEDLYGSAYVTDHFGETGKNSSDWLKYKKHSGPHKKSKSGKICMFNSEILSYPLVNNWYFG